MIGLETAFSVGVTELVKKNILTLPELIKKLTTGPAEVLNIERGIIKEGSLANITIVDKDKKYTVDKEFFVGKSKNSPFIGRELTGSIEGVFVNGKLKYDKGVFNK